jgi:hypothetical protein
MRRNLELIAEVRRELDRSPSMNLRFNPERLAFRALIVEALMEYPAARAAVIAAIGRHEQLKWAWLRT